MSGLFLLVDGYLDGMAAMGDRVYNKSYQDLWFSYLDTGAKVPGFAETDFFLNQVSQHNELDTFRNYPHIGNRPLTAQSIRDAAHSGEVFFSNGGFLNVSVDGVPMGSVVRTSAAKRHRVRIEVYPGPNSRLGRIEIIGKDAAVLATKDKVSGGVLEYEIPGHREPGYVVVRAFGSGDDPDHDPDHVRYLAVSNPIYLWPQGFHPQRARTSCTIRIASGSKWIGGSLEFETAYGQRIRREPIHAGVIFASVPADSRVVLSKEGLRSRMFYIVMENAEVERDISYLSTGEFRKDYPGLQQSVVPPEAFRLESLREALKRFEYEIR